MSGFESLAQLISGAALNSLLQGILIAATAWALVRITGRSSSAIRFIVWFSALLAIAAVFFWGGWMVPGAAARRSEFAIPSHWSLYVFSIWGAVAALGLARIAFGVWKVRAIRNNCTALDPAMRMTLPTVENSSRQISICASDEVRVPTAIGFFHPTIVLPVWALNQLSPEELSAVVLHELAHLERRDDWTNLAQKVIRALLFFHPAVWWIDDRLSMEREMSCDDAVLARSTEPRRYAECLVSVAEKGFLRRQIALAQAAVSHVKHTAQRIARILDGKQRKSVPAWKAASAALTTFCALSFVAVEHTPRLVAFTDDSRPAAEFASQMSVPRAAVIMASAKGDQMRQPSALTHYAVKFNHTTSSRKQNRAKNPQVTPRLALLSPRNVKAGRSSLISAMANAADAPQVVVLMFETGRYDNSGSFRVTTVVWHVMLQPPARVSTTDVVFPRST